MISLFFASKTTAAILLATVLLVSCDSPQDTNSPGGEDNSNPPSTSQPDESSQSLEIKSLADARLVLKENLLSEGDTSWDGYYSVTLPGSILDGPFEVSSQRTVPDYPNVPIMTTYTGQYQQGMESGEFTVIIDAPAGQTKYQLVYSEDGTCKQGKISQAAEGDVIDQVVDKPSPCTFATLRDVLYF